MNRKRIIRYSLLVLLLVGAAWLLQWGYYFYKCEMGPLHIIDNANGKVCPCEYGDIHITVSEDAQASCSLTIGADRVYIQTEQEEHALHFSIHIFPGFGRIPVDTDANSTANFTVTVPQELFLSPGGYIIHGTRWVGNQEQPYPAE